MKRFLCLLIMCLPLIMHAQEEKGIKWITGLSWEQVKQKAKAENKYIFLDCFTTWCGPCKAMDKYIYPNDTVGQFFNNNFISVRVQFDQTEKDNENVKNWYPAVKELSERYVIEGYPSFLFFTPDGKAVHKEAGYKEVLKLVKMADWALVTDDRVEDVYEKYTRLIQEFKNGKINYQELPFLVINAKKRGDTISRIMLRAHEEYVSKMSKKDRYTKANIEFWSTLNLTSDRKIIQFFYKDGEMIDEIIRQKGFSHEQVDKCIQNFIVRPFIYQNTPNPDTKNGVTTIVTFFDSSSVNALKTYQDEADWDKLYRIIKTHFNKEYAKKHLLQAKIFWYKQNNNWEAWVRVAFEELKAYPPNLKENGNACGEVNDLAWNSFLFVKDKKLINEAIIWMKQIVQVCDDPNFMDTYANLLYKAGRKNEAIHWQEKAVSFSPLDKAFQEALEQMKKGEPTNGVCPIK